jgi:hypothetical protein
LFYTGLLAKSLQGEDQAPKKPNIGRIFGEEQAVASSLVGHNTKALLPPPSSLRLVLHPNLLPSSGFLGTAPKSTS